MVSVVDINVLFAVFGALVIIANLGVLITFSSKTKFIEKYLFLIALALADITAGGAAFSCGYMRMLVFQEVPVPNFTVADCMKTIYLPLIVIGGEWPAVIMLFIGMERLLAVITPIFYRKKYKTVHKAGFIAFSVAVFSTYLSFAYGQRLIYGGMDKLVTPNCVMNPTFLPIFDDIHRSIVVFANLLGFCLTSVALLEARRLSKKSGAQAELMRAEVKRINLVIILSGFCVLQATIPQFLFWMSFKGLLVFPNNIDYFNAIVFYTGSLINLFIYLVMKEDFRNRFVFLVTCGKTVNCSSNKSPVQSTNTSKLQKGR